MDTPLDASLSELAVAVADTSLATAATVDAAPSPPASPRVGASSSPSPLRAPSPPPLLASSSSSSLDVGALCDSLASTAAVPAASRSHLSALYSLAATTLARHGFSRAQLVAVLELLRGVVEEDMRSLARTAGASFASLQARLLAASVARPPRSVGTFTPAQASTVVHLVLTTYYASFELYKTLRAPVRLELTQRAPSDVPAPERAPALATAVQLA